jgi:hypothetical protein
MITGGGPEMNLNLARYMDGSAEGVFTLMQCRTVRIGSFKAVPLEPVLLCAEGVRICVPYPGQTGDKTEGE